MMTKKTKRSSRKRMQSRNPRRLGVSNKGMTYVPDISDLSARSGGFLATVAAIAAGAGRAGSSATPRKASGRGV